MTKRSETGGTAVESSTSAESVTDLRTQFIYHQQQQQQQGLPAYFGSHLNNMATALSDFSTSANNLSPQQQPIRSISGSGGGAGGIPAAPLIAAPAPAAFSAGPPQPQLHHQV